MPMKKIYSYNEDNKVKSLHIKRNVGLISTCELFKKREMAFIGISLGNSYYTVDRLKLILSAFSSTFKEVSILLVDDLAIHNYRAIGYPDDKIRRKIKKETNGTRNRINKVIKYVEDKNNVSNIKFYQWKDVEQFDGYHEALEDVKKIYENDCEFSSEVKQLTLNILGKHTDDNNTENFILNEGKWYILKELAFGLCASEFFKSSIFTCYYADFPLYRELLISNSRDSIYEHETLTYECAIDDAV